jgi:broad specificity phosphatase PhoE
MENSKTASRIYLIRHGVTDWIEQGILHGISDRPLSAFGLEQAELTAQALRGLRASHLYTSPLARAVQTAQAIGQRIGLTPEPIDTLKEMNYGWLEGKKDLWPKVRRHASLTIIYHAYLDLAGLTGGESPRKFEKRVICSWKALRSTTYEDALIVVAHFKVLRTILKYEFGSTGVDAGKFTLGACSISEIEVFPDAPSRIVQLNSLAHLNGKTQK